MAENVARVPGFRRRRAAFTEILNQRLEVSTSVGAELPSYDIRLLVSGFHWRRAATTLKGSLGVGVE